MTRPVVTFFAIICASIVTGCEWDTYNPFTFYYFSAGAVPDGSIVESVDKFTSELGFAKSVTEWPVLESEKTHMNIDYRNSDNLRILLVVESGGRSCFSLSVSSVDTSRLAETRAFGLALLATLEREYPNRIRIHKSGLCRM